MLNDSINVSEVKLSQLFVPHVIANCKWISVQYPIFYIQIDCMNERRLKLVYSLLG